MRRVASDLHVLVLKQSPDDFSGDAAEFRTRLSRLLEAAQIGLLFDIVEFFIRHPKRRQELRRDLASAFVTSRAAYRVIDGEFIAAIGTAEQGEAFERSLKDCDDRGALAARKQLIAAGIAIRNGDWPGAVRESIHAVEAVAVQLAPGTDTLGPALRMLEQRGHLHGSLKAAFGALYGYASDEEGIRHALVFADGANVDEADALFMLGACASFVSYLLARS